MRAVAPHTVSSSSTKKCIARSPQCSTWCTDGSSSSESATSNTRSTSPGAATRWGRAARMPTNGAIRKGPPTLGRWSSSATISTDSGASPTSSCASRSAAAAASTSTAGSILPPGNAISPWWVGRCAGRRVSTMRASSASSNSASNTAASRAVDGSTIGTNSPEPARTYGGRSGRLGGGRSRTRARTSATAIRRVSGASAAHGDSSRDATGGRGMRCWPPRAPELDMRCSAGRRALLLLLAARELGEHVAARQHEEVLTVDGDLGAAVLRVEDDVAGGDVHRDQLTGLVRATARSDGEHLTLLRLLLGGVRDDEAAHGRLLGLARPNDDAILERLQVHQGCLQRCCRLRGSRWVGARSCPRGWRAGGLAPRSPLALLTWEC